MQMLCAMYGRHNTRNYHGLGHAEQHMYGASYEGHIAAAT